MANTDKVHLTAGAKQALEMARKLNLTMTSGYRTPTKDKQVGGTGSGYHTKGLAMDFAGSNKNMDTFAKWAKDSRLFRSVLWQVAGHYDHVHISWSLDGTEGDKSPTDGIVKNGNVGGIVEAIQKLISGLLVDGIFGDKTEAAVKNFQKQEGIEQDGIVGQQTWDKLTSGGGLFFYK